MIITGITLFGFYSGLLLLDDKTQEQTDEDKRIEKKWHMVGGLIVVYLAFVAFMLGGWIFIPLVFTFAWLIFAGIVHIIGMKKPFFYVGNFAWTDKLLRKIFGSRVELLSGIIKVVLFILSIILIFI